MGRLVADLVLTLALGACWGGGAPDQILVNGKIFTADPARLWVGGIAIRGDRIVAVGASESLRGLAGPRTQLRDLGARTVIPGINDAHAHVGPVPRAVTVATTPDAGLREVVDSLARVSRRRPRGTWLITTIGDRVLDDPRANRFFLDSVVPDHPAVLESWSGHEAILNSAALGALGLGHETRDPLGGHFGRAGGSGPGAGAGALDGRLSEYAWWNTRRRLSSGVGDSAARADLRDYAAQAARFGITSVQDMNTALSATRAVFLLHGVDGPIRWRVIRFPLTGPDGRALADLRERRARPGGELDVSGAAAAARARGFPDPRPRAARAAPRRHRGPEPRPLRRPSAAAPALPGGARRPRAAAALAPRGRDPDRAGLGRSHEPVPQHHARRDPSRGPERGAHPRAGGHGVHPRLRVRGVRRAGPGNAHAGHAGGPDGAVAGHLRRTGQCAAADGECADAGGWESGVRCGSGEISDQSSVVGRQSSVSVD